jgi:hypothetical protein
MHLYKLYSELNTCHERPFCDLDMWNPDKVRKNGFWPMYTVRLVWIWKIIKFLQH